MSYELTYLSEAIDDMEKLDGSQRKMVRKALRKLKDNRCRKPKAAMASGLETNKASTYPDF